MGDVVWFPGRDRWLTKRQVAEEFKVTPRTVERWHRERGLPAHRPTPGTVRYRLSEIEAWIGQQQPYGGLGRPSAWAERA